MEIKWRQESFKRLIISVKDDQQERHFLLSERVINHLAAHRQVHMHVIINGGREESFLVNFSGLKPAANMPEGGYGVKSLREESGEVQLPDKCAIARGETFSSRWLTPKGWSAEKHYFPLQPAVPMDTAVRVACPSCGKSIPAASRFCGYCGKKLGEAESTIICRNTACGRSIRAGARFCPYCGEKQ